MTVKIGSVTEAEALLEGIDAAVFDLDDTLYPEKDYVRSGFEAAASLFPDKPDAAAFSARLGRRKRCVFTAPIFRISVSIPECVKCSRAFTAGKNSD